MQNVLLFQSKHRCTDCDRGFRVQSELRAHIRKAHPDVWAQMEQDELAAKPHGCNKCEAKFASTDSLIKHVKANHVLM